MEEKCQLIHTILFEDGDEVNFDFKSDEKEKLRLASINSLKNLTSGNKKTFKSTDEKIRFIFFDKYNYKN